MSTRTVTVAIAAALAHGAVAERFFWNKLNDLSVADNWVGATPASDANWVDFPACASQEALSVSVNTVRIRSPHPMTSHDGRSVAPLNFCPT